MVWRKGDAMLERQKTRREVQTVSSGFGCGEAMISIYVPYGTVSVPAAIYARLDEWARWARPRIGLDSHGCCASAEGRFVSRHPDAERGACAIEHDLTAVLAVERVVCTRLPPVSKKIIVRHFVLLNTPQAIALSLGIHKARYGDEIKRAVLMVKNNLTRA